MTLNNCLCLLGSAAFIFVQSGWTNAHPGPPFAGDPDVEVLGSQLASSSGGNYNYEFTWQTVGTGHSLLFVNESWHHQKSNAGIVWVELDHLSDHHGTVVPVWPLNTWHRGKACWHEAPIIGSVCPTDQMFIPAVPCGSGAAH